MVPVLDLILLIDDDTVTNLMHRRQIIRGEWARGVEIATDGRAALDLLEDRRATGAAPPELILLDINMPRMNGFEFLDAYGRLAPELRADQKIVMVSTSTLPQDLARAEANPYVSRFYEKPLSDDDLQEIVAVCSQG